MIKKRITHIFISLFLVLSFPVSALADTVPEAAPTTTSATTPAAATDTPQHQHQP
jgi:hypothetical protein